MSAIDTTCYSISQEIESGDGEMKCFKPVPYEDSSSVTNIIASEIVNDILESALDLVMERNKKQGGRFEKISSNVVGDILENILSTSSGAENFSENTDETSLLDDEIKRIIKEMKCPPEQKNPICTIGVGDQLTDKKEITTDKVLTEPSKRNTLERKNRLTNLVKNSKLMLAKLVTNDTSERELKTEDEERNEIVIKVTDLEDDKDSPSCLHEENQNRNQFPRDSVLDLVDLDPATNEKISNEEIQLDMGENEACCSRDHLEDQKENKAIKKRWNFGAKIMKILKRQPKKEKMLEH